MKREVLTKVCQKRTFEEVVSGLDRDYIDMLEFCLREAERQNEKWLNNPLDEEQAKMTKYEFDTAVWFFTFLPFFGKRDMVMHHNGYSYKFLYNKESGDFFCEIMKGTNVQLAAYYYEKNKRMYLVKNGPKDGLISLLGDITYKVFYYS